MTLADFRAVVAGTDPRPRRNAYEPPEEPTYDYLVGLWHELEVLYRDQDDQIRRMREVRELKRPVSLPPKVRLVEVEVRDPTATDEIQRVVATLTVNPPKLTVTPARPGDAGEKNAELRRDWTEGMLRVAGRRVPGLDTFQKLVDAVVGDGGGWTKFLFSNDMWDARYGLVLDDYKSPSKYIDDVETAKKAAGPPFTWLCPDVLTLYPIWTGTELTEMIEVQRRPVYSTLRQYGLQMSSGGAISSGVLGQATDWRAIVPGASVVRIEYWSKKYYSTAIVGETVGGNSTGALVDSWPHEYGRVPYFYSPGLMMNHWANRKVGWSVAESKRFLVEYLSFLITLHAQHAARDTLPPVMRTKEVGAEALVGDDRRPIGPEIWDIRQIIDLRPGEKLIPFAFPDVANSLKEQIAFTREAIQRLDTPRVESIGQGVEGAGFAINQQLSEVKIRHAPLADSIQRQLDEVTRFAWSMARDVVGEPIWIQQDGASSGWLSAGPDDLTDGVGIAWELDAEQPSAKLIQERMYTEMMNAGFIDLDGAITALGGSPDEVRLGRQIDKIRASDEYQKIFQQQVLEALGRGDVVAQAVEAQQIVASGIVPGATIPPPMGGAPGSAPDMGNLALGPNGMPPPSGAAPPGNPQAPMQPSQPPTIPAPNLGVGTSPVVPARSAVVQGGGAGG